MAVMGWLYKVQQFMHNYIFKAFQGFLGQLKIKSNDLCFRRAAPPFGFHPLDDDAFCLNPQCLPPFFDHRQHGSLELLTIPLIQNTASFFGIRA